MGQPVRACGDDPCRIWAGQGRGYRASPGHWRIIRRVWPGGAMQAAHGANQTGGRREPPAIPGGAQETAGVGRDAQGW